MKTINVTEKTGKLVGILDVAEKEDLMITCKSGVMIRMKVADISEQGRATQGVKLIRLDEGDEIAAITRIDVQEELKENGNGENGNGENGDHLNDSSDDIGATNPGEEASEI